MKLIFLYELFKTISYQFVFVLLNHRWLSYHGATGMSLLGGGIGRTPRPAKDFCPFLSLKREASPTQKDLNFECKVWHCKLFIIKKLSIQLILLKILIKRNYILLCKFFDRLTILGFFHKSFLKL